MMRFSVLALALLLTGCASNRMVQVKVPIPVACQVAEPARPMMDTDTLPLTAAIDEMARAMRAEIERRDGYETELRAALNACKTVAN